MFHSCVRLTRTILTFTLITFCSICIEPCCPVKIGLVGPKIILKSTHEATEFGFEDGSESCPNQVETKINKPVRNTEKNEKPNFRRNILSSIKDEVSSRVYSNIYEENQKITKAEKKRKFLNGIRKKLVYFASSTSSSTALLGLATSSSISSEKDKRAFGKRFDGSLTSKPNSNSDSNLGRQPKDADSSILNEKIKSALISRELPYRVPVEMKDPMSHDQYTDEELEEGAKLISASFRFISSSVGLVADSVRIVGDTTAGVAGSTMKLAGKAVKSVSVGVDSIGSSIEGREKQIFVEKRPLTSSLIGTEYEGLQLNYRKNTGTYNGLLKSTRAVTGKTVRLLGSVVHGIGDSIVLVGSATETITSSTAGIAEDTVRVVEDFVGSLSDIFTPHQHQSELNFDMKEVPKRRQRNPKRLLETLKQIDSKTEQPEKRIYVRYEETKHHDTPSDQNLTKHDLHQQSDGILATFLSEGNILFDYLFSEVEGIPSLGYHILGVNILLYLTTIMFLTFPKKKQSTLKEETNPQDGSEQKSISCKGEHGILHTFTSLRRSDNEFVARTKSNAYIFFALLLLPVRLVLWTISSIINVIISRHSVLAGIHIVAFISVSRNSQLRSNEIRRKAEVAGFREAINTIRDPASSSKESATWFNLLLEQVWRVNFPIYDNSANRCPCGRHERDCICAGNISYGGLEPLISSYLGEALIDAMESTSYMQPNDIAYVYLDSITLGTSAPIIRSILVQSVEKEGEVINLRMDVDAMLEDSDIVLDIKLSNLDYALLPTTKLSINSLDVQTSLELSITSSPTYPYISTLNVTMERLPKYKFKVTPLSESSGLKGLDLASFPLLNSWIENTVDISLMMSYVKPKYISIDMIEFFSANKYVNGESLGCTGRFMHESGQIKRDQQVESLNQFQKMFHYDFRPKLNNRENEKKESASQRILRTGIPPSQHIAKKNAKMKTSSTQSQRESEEVWDNKASDVHYPPNKSEYPSSKISLENDLSKDSSDKKSYVSKETDKMSFFQSVGDHFNNILSKAGTLVIAAIAVPLIFERETTKETP